MLVGQKVTEYINQRKKVIDCLVKLVLDDSDRIIDQLLQ